MSNLIDFVWSITNGILLLVPAIFFTYMVVRFITHTMSHETDARDEAMARREKPVEPVAPTLRLDAYWRHVIEDGPATDKANRMQVRYRRQRRRKVVR